VTEPFVGAPTDGQGCAFSAALDAPACGADAVTHILSEAPGWGPVGLETCTRHEPVARAAGAVMGEHPWGPLCRSGDCWVVDTP
jgi:hypothetical protein